VPFRRQRPDARLRLFCFPYSGGGASIYRTWSDALAPDVELCAVQLPGRETRFKEPAATGMSGLVDQVVEGIKPLLDRPFALFGHSFGALVSFEMAHKLQSLGFRPEHLFVSGRQAPHLNYPRSPIHQLGDEAFSDEMRRLNGTPEHVLSNPALLSLVIGIVRPDYTVCETYRFREGRPLLECPVTALGGSEDPETTPDDLESWGRHTGGDFEARMLPGDHFFIHAQEGLVLETVSDRLHLGPVS
jgi:medium-chain acyl-[acyl-carrier-protein] hydrolase